MCETHIVYNLCGHVRIKTVVQCAEMIDALLASNLQATCSQRLCANSAGHETDNAENIHIFPDICDKCTRNGVVGILMREQPSVKIDLIRAWKKDTHLKKQNQGQSQDQKEMESAAEGLQIASPSGESSSAVDSTKDSEHDTSGIIAETQPVAVSDLAGASMTDAASHPSISSPSDGTAISQVTSVGSSSYPSSALDLESVKTRINALRTRTDQLLSRLRTYKSMKGRSTI
jgi:hypothetical protein